MSKIRVNIQSGDLSRDLMKKVVAASVSGWYYERLTSIHCK